MGKGEDEKRENVRRGEHEGARGGGKEKREYGEWAEDAPEISRGWAGVGVVVQGGWEAETRGVRRGVGVELGKDRFNQGEQGEGRY